MITVTPLSGNIKKKLKAFGVDLKQLKKDSLVEFKALTPIRSGNARRRTTLSGSTIEANYPYAGKLDDGASTQAPRGMVEPFQKWFSKQVKRIFSGK